MQLRTIRNTSILVLLTLLIFGFQNCSNLNSTDLHSFGGGEPYPGSPASEIVPGQFLSNNSVCSDGRVSDEITFVPPDFYTERRENCTDVNRALQPSSLQWTKSFIEFIYNGKIYKFVM